MNQRTFLNGVANGKRDILEWLIGFLETSGTPYCVVGGLAVNAYVEPVVSLDLDIIVAAGEAPMLREAAMKSGMTVDEFEHSVNIASPDSDLRIQLQTDARYQAFLTHAAEQRVLGYRMRVATIENVLQGKLWAYGDATRRRSKRQKDLADIFRLVESYPELESHLPESVRKHFD